MSFCNNHVRHMFIQSQWGTYETVPSADYHSLESRMACQSCTLVVEISLQESIVCLLGGPKKKLFYFPPP